MSLFRRRPHDCIVDGHCFEARYDERPDREFRMEGRWMTVDAVRKLIVIRTYVHDVCVHCGKIIDRNK